MRLTPTWLAALAIATAPNMAHAATDGTLGNTSTGSFNAYLTFQAPGTGQVQVIGLDDFVYGIVKGQVDTTTQLPVLRKNFCLLRSNAGMVRVTINQASVPDNSSFELNDGNGNRIPLFISLRNPDGSGPTPTSGETVIVPASGQGCTSGTTDASIAHQFILSPGPLPAQTAGAVYGDYSGFFQVLVAPQ